MKNRNVALVAVAWLVFSFACNNNHPSHCGNGVIDGNETGIDCGGDCPPCPTSPNNVNPNFFGSWYSLFRVSETANMLQMYINNTNAACRVDIINTSIYPTMPTSYKSYGMINACSYPVETTTLYTPYSIKKLTVDSMIYNNGANLTIMKKGGNPYLGQSPYVKVRFVVLNNEGGDSSVWTNDKYWMQGDPYIEVIGSNSTSAGAFNVVFNRVVPFNGGDYSPPSWAVAGQVYHITYKIQILDVFNNIMYESQPDTKVLWGETSAINPFVSSSVFVQWGNY